MNKHDFVKALAEKLSLPHTKAEESLNAVMDLIESSLVEGQTITFVGFGQFGVKTRAARTGRNPKTGEPLNIPAAKVPYFTPGKKLKDAIKN
ncbi:MAG: DNA-binding protein HU [Legionellaceae bacterium]